MKINILLLSTLFFSNFCYAQNTKLDSKNGFKKIKLNTNLNSYADFKLSLPPAKYRIFDNPVYEYVGNDMTSIGGIPIEKIYVSVNYQMIITRIRVFCPVDMNIINALKEAYGATSLESKPRKESCGAIWRMYTWYGNKADLLVSVNIHQSKFDSDNCSVPDQIELSFTSNIEDKKNIQRNKQKIKSASEDF